MKKDNQRAIRILDSADTLFCEAGFDGTSIRDIAQRAEVNKALVFYYFNTKEELFQKVVERYYAEHQKALEAAFGSGDRLEDRVHRLIDAYLDYVEEHRGFPRLMQSCVVSRNSADIDLVRRGMAPLLEWTERALSEVTPVEGPLAARHFFLTFSGAVINFFTHGPLLTPIWGVEPTSKQGITERREHLHWLVDVILAGLEAIE